VDSKILGTLRSSELEILAAATTGAVYFIDLEYPPSGVIRTATTNFDVPGDPGYAARYVRAFRSLCKKGLIEHDGEQLYVLTLVGDEIATDHRRRCDEARRVVEELTTGLETIATVKATMDDESPSQLFVRWKTTSLEQLLEVIGLVESKRFRQLGPLEQGIVPCRRPREADDHYRVKLAPYFDYLTALRAQLQENPHQLLAAEYSARISEPSNSPRQVGSITVTGHNARVNINSLDASTNVAETDPDQMR